MRIVPPIAYAAEDGNYRNIDGISPGSKIPAEIFNSINAEIPGLITASGFTPSGSDLAQLTRAVRSQRVNWRAASSVTGTANAIILTFSPAFSSLAELVGVPVRFLIENNVTAALSVDVDGLGARDVVSTGGVTLAANSYLAGDLAEVIYNGTAFVAKPRAATAAQIAARSGVGYLTATDLASVYVGLAPIGGVIPVAHTTIPSGWLTCNGAAISRSSYPELFSALGTTHGAGDGSTTFNLPDYRGMFLRGLDQGRGVDPSRVLGARQKGAIVAAEQLGTSGSHMQGIRTDAGGGSDAYYHNLGYDRPANADYVYPQVNRIFIQGIGHDGAVNADSLMGVTRPVNQSVIFIIRAF